MGGPLKHSIAKKQVKINKIDQIHKKFTCHIDEYSS